MKRSELPDEVFGIPEERKYPMPDKRHTLSAIKLFGHVEPKYEEELAKNIIKNMKKYNIPESAVGKDNKLRKYIDKYYNESVELIEEKYIMNEDDIYYNKDKFDSGEINLCFITGHSGSGKSTMGRNMQSDNIEHYELDDLQCIKDHFTMQNLKEYGDLIYSYFNGQGKRFYVTYQDLKDNNTPGSEYEDILFKDFVHYAMKYAKSHKNKKYVIEGVWLYCDDDNGTPWFTPEEFKDYAFYIKGTSAIISKHRAALRDAREDSKGNKINTIKIYLNMIRKNWKWYLVDEKALNKFRKYFSGLMQTNESSILESSADEYERVEVPLTEEVLIEAANNAARHTKWCKMESFPFCSVHELQSCVVSVKNASFAFATFDGSEKDLNYVINSCNKNNTFRYGKYEVSCITNSQGTKYLCGKITELYEYVKKSILTEETRLDNAPSNMYHLSTENHDGDVFEPRYYDNDNVKAGTERRVKRICFSDSINGCIYSIFPSGAYDVDLYVHVPGSEVTKVYETTPDDIYDSNITHELWVKEPVTMKCIGKIHISGVYKDKVKVLEADKDKTGYGKRKYYEPRWNWVEKINEATSSSEYSMKPLKPEQMKEYYKWFKVVFNGTKDSITEKETKPTKVIYYNNEIIGYVAFSRYKDGNERYLGLGNFMIIPKYQRSGHGANVVKYIIDKYKDTYDLIYCWVDRSNTNAVNFYKKIAKVNMNTQSNPNQYYVEFYRKGKKIMNETYIEEQSTSSVKIYHLSQSNLDGKTLSPRVPSNYFTKNGYEDGKTARVCFAKSIDMCLRALSQKCTDMELFVHIPDGKYNIYIPSTKEVPDAKITSEAWIKEPVKLKCIGKIKVIKDKGEDGIPYKYGDNTAELYDWEWKWIEKMNEASIISNIQDDYNPKGKKSLSSFKKEKISKDSLDKYKKDFKALSHIRENCLGYIYLDKNIPMAVIAVEEKSDCNFIQAVEIAKNYQGYGLSKQLLDVATKELKATRLSVNKKNKLAIEIYKKYGFKKYDESESMMFMSINETNLKEFSVGAGPVVGIGSNPEPIYIVNYMQNNVFSGATQERFGICKAGMKDLHTFGGKYNRLHFTNLEEFEKEASNIKVYRYTGPLSDNYSSIYSIIEDADTDLDFYRLLTGNEIDNRSSIKNDPYFQRESYINDELSAITECVVAGVKEIDNKYEIPMIGLNEDGRVYNYYRDLDGVYIKNEVTNMRSGSYDDINDIPEEVNNLVIKGVY